MTRTTGHAEICRTRGDGSHPYVVAQAKRGVLRFCRLAHHGEAVLVAAEWNSGDYTVMPGELRRFVVPAPIPTIQASPFPQPTHERASA